MAKKQNSGTLLAPYRVLDLTDQAGIYRKVGMCVGSLMGV
jgi:hypothetical protein